jgi:hypothetical protein
MMDSQWRLFENEAEALGGEAWLGNFDFGFSF